MSYGTSAQALSYMGRLGKTTNGTSVPSITDLATFVTDCSNQIDSHLKSRGLSVPVTTPAEFVAELASLNAKGAAGYMMTSAYISNDSNDRGTGAILLKEFLGRLSDFDKGLGLPVGTAVFEPDLAPLSPWSGANAREVRPMFSREARW